MVTFFVILFICPIFKYFWFDFVIFIKIWSFSWLWTVPGEVDPDCEAVNRDSPHRKCVALVAGSRVWVPHLYQDMYPIPANQENLAPSLQICQGEAFLLLLECLGFYYYVHQSTHRASKLLCCHHKLNILQQAL